jgi:hypothetical protein
VISPFQLVKSRYQLLHIELNGEHDPASEFPLSLNIETSSKINQTNETDNTDEDEIITEDTSGGVLVRLSNEGSLGNYPIQFIIVAEGDFLLHPHPDGIEKTKVEMLVKVNGGSLLYSQAREMYSLLTARVYGTALTLPGVIPQRAFHSTEDQG